MIETKKFKIKRMSLSCLLAGRAMISFLFLFWGTALERQGQANADLMSKVLAIFGNLLVALAWFIIFDSIRNLLVDTKSAIEFGRDQIIISQRPFLTLKYNQLIAIYFDYQFGTFVNGRHTNLWECLALLYRQDYGQGIDSRLIGQYDYDFDELKHVFTQLPPAIKVSPYVLAHFDHPKETTVTPEAQLEHSEFHKLYAPHITAEQFALGLLLLPLFLIFGFNVGITAFTKYFLPFIPRNTVWFQALAMAIPFVFWKGIFDIDKILKNRKLIKPEKISHATQ